MKLFICRHGQTEPNRKGLVQGSINDGLNKTGRIQAKLLGKYLKKRGVNKIYCSTLKRSIETAEIISKICSAEIKKDKRIGERNFGEFEGLTTEQVLERVPEWKKIRELRYWESAPRNGESWDDVKRRVWSFFKGEIKPLIKTDEKIAVIGHGGMNRVMLNLIARIHVGPDNDIAQDNCCVNELTINRDGYKYNVALLNINYTCFLGKYITKEPGEVG